MADETTPGTPDTPETWPGRDDPAADHPTAPILPPAAPPPSGLPFDPATDPDPGPAEQPWRAEYLAERRKSRIFMGSTAVVGALLAGSLVYASAQGGNPTGQTLAGQQLPGQAGQGMPGGRGMDRDPDGDDGMGGRGMGGPGTSGQGEIRGGFVEQFFAQDGSLDSEMVEQFRDSAAAQQMSEQLLAEIAREVQEGHITQAQADELIAALNPESGSQGSGSGA